MIRRKKENITDNDKKTAKKKIKNRSMYIEGT